MPKLFLLFSHRLTEEQDADAWQSLRVTDIVALPQALQARWSNVPAELKSLDEYAAPILTWLQQEAQPNDYVLAQGDYGLTYLTVTFALRHGLIPVYATTTRDVVETRLSDGTVQVQRVFKHVRFRQYHSFNV